MNFSSSTIWMETMIWAMMISRSPVARIKRAQGEGGRDIAGRQDVGGGEVGPKVEGSHGDITRIALTCVGTIQLTRHSHGRPHA